MELYFWLKYIHILSATFLFGTGICWLIVVFIQYRLHRLAKAGFIDHALYFQQCMHWWIALGIPAFIALLFIYWLMITKWGITISLF